MGYTVLLSTGSRSVPYYVFTTPGWKAVCTSPDCMIQFVLRHIFPILISVGEIGDCHSIDLRVTAHRQVERKIIIT